LEDKVSAIRASLEKILKAIIIKIENGDQITAANELKWFDDLLLDIYSLKEKDFKLFKELVDPLNRHIIVEHTDLSKIDWSKVVYKESKGPRPSKQERRRSYTINLWQEEYDLLDSFLSFSIKVWEAAARAEHFGVAKRAVYAIGNIYGYVAFGTNTTDKFNYISYYNFVNQMLTYRLDSLLSARGYNEENNSLIRFMMFQFHLDHFRDDRFGIEKFDNFSKGLFGNLKVAIDRSQTDFINAFVRALSGFILKPVFDNPYADLHSAIRDRFDELKIEQNDILRKIPQLGLWKPYYLFSTHQYVSLSERVDALQKELITLVKNEDISSFIKEKILQIKSYVLAHHKYRIIQGALVKALIYSIFRKQYEVVDFALQFEEPVDADAMWGNKDILPNDLRDIMLFIYEESEIQHELMFYFPDRHGSPRYINIFCIGLLYRYSNYEREENHVVSQVQSFLVTNVDDWREIHDTMKRAFVELQARSKRLYEQQDWPFVKKNEMRYDRLMNLFGLILKSIESHKTAFESREV
jgi:hypothetical protein